MGIQEALLEDEALIEAALAAIARGEAADAAWRDAMADEIAGYEAADDEYFRARAADLADVRDRVLRHLSGAAPALECAPGAVLSRRTCRHPLFLGHRLVARRRDRARRGQPHQPCRHAGALARRADGCRRRRRLPRRCRHADRRWRQRPRRSLDPGRDARRASSAASAAAASHADAEAEARAGRACADRGWHPHRGDDQRRRAGRPAELDPGQLRRHRPGADRVPGRRRALRG